MPFFLKLKELIESSGYLGVFLGMFVESSFIPFPSELVVLPAGYACYTGYLTSYGVVLAGSFGSLAGAVFNYCLASCASIKFFERFGVSADFLSRVSAFIERHGMSAVFYGRLLPFVRQVISLPAGLVGLNFPLFCLLTFVGSFIWCTTLVVIGYFFGSNLHQATSIVSWIGLGLFVALVLVVSVTAYRRCVCVSKK